MNIFAGDVDYVADCASKHESGRPRRTPLFFVHSEVNSAREGSNILVRLTFSMPRLQPQGEKQRSRIGIVQKN